MNTTITRLFGFDYGHRVLGHESKCANLHGHRGTAELTVMAPGGLDRLGRVIDFSDVKLLVGNWIDERWDHNMLLHPDDPLLVAVRTAWAEDAIDLVPVFFGRKKPYVLPPGMNPTAENMAQLLFKEASILLRPRDITVVQVRLWETPNCHADYSGT